MPRQAREKGAYSTYHIILRGNERREIFLGDEDKLKFIDILDKVRKRYCCIFEAYCLMDNHVHMIINDNGHDISQIMKSLNISYVYYFNKAYNRVGHLFQDRFKSELVMDENYLLQVSVYIHNNPVKAGIVKRPEDYRWSSIHDYLGKQRLKQELVDPSRILDMLSVERRRAVAAYYKRLGQI